MKAVKRITVLLLIVEMLCLTGCWNYREVDNLSMVGGFAIDKGKEDHKYHVTFEFLDLSKSPPGSKLLETEGDTVFDAVRNAISKSEKKLFFSDCKVVVISQSIAQEGITPLLDWVFRDAEPRITINPVISEAPTAAEVLQQKPVTDQLSSLEIWRTISQNTTNLSEVPNVELYEAVDRLTDEGISLTLPCIKISESKDQKTLELDGAAVFKKDKLVGYLNRDETKYYLFVKNLVKGGLLVVSPENNDQSICLEMQDSRTKVTPKISNATASIQINTKVKAALGEDQTTQDYVNEKNLEKAEKGAEKLLKDNMTSVIKKVQTQFDSDIFGFGKIIHQTSPEFWNKNKSNWDELFKNLKCTVTTEVSINNTATAKDEIKVED